MTIESDLHRIANALEVIGNEFVRLRHGRELATLQHNAQFLPHPAAAPVPVDASQLYISGQWKRRAGDIYATPLPRDAGGDDDTPSPPQDPWIRPDVPAVEPREGLTGLNPNEGILV